MLTNFLLCRLVCVTNLLAMTTETTNSGDDPQGLLSSAHALTQRVRKDQRATWFPLLVFAVLTFISIPVRRYSGHHLTCRASAGSRACTAASNFSRVACSGANWNAWR